MDGYAAAKKRIFRNTRSERQIAVIGVDDDHGAAIAAELSRLAGVDRNPDFLQESPKNGVSVIDGSLSDQTDWAATFRVSTHFEVSTGRMQLRHRSVARALDIDPER